jgi:hypothetical protein
LAESASSAVPSATRITVRTTAENPLAQSGHSTTASGKCLPTMGCGIELLDKDVS